MVHAGLRGDIHLGEFDGKALGAEHCRGGLSGKIDIRKPPDTFVNFRV
jgi:hypothetical protein